MAYTIRGANIRDLKRAMRVLPREEEEAIARFLDREAAVTGKIDVREQKAA